MLEKYIDWDKAVIKMIRKHRDNQIALENLREQYEEVTQSLDSVGATDYSKPRVSGSSGDPSDGLVNQILLKQTLEHRIAALKAEELQYDKAWSELTIDEQNILQEFFQMGQRPSQQAVDVLCEMYGYEKSKIYYLRHEALSRFKSLLIG